MRARLAIGVLVTLVGLVYLGMGLCARDAALHIAAPVIATCLTALAVNALRGKGEYKHGRR